jgi:hypothetical protein
MSLETHPTGRITSSCARSLRRGVNVNGESMSLLPARRRFAPTLTGGWHKNDEYSKSKEVVHFMKLFRRNSNGKGYFISYAGCQ